MSVPVQTVFTKLGMQVERAMLNIGSFLRVSLRIYDQIQLVLFVQALGINKVAECYICKVGLYEFSCNSERSLSVLRRNISINARPDGKEIQETWLLRDFINLFGLYDFVQRNLRDAMAAFFIVCPLLLAQTDSCDLPFWLMTPMSSRIGWLATWIEWRPSQSFRIRYRYRAFHLSYLLMQCW